MIWAMKMACRMPDCTSGTMSDIAGHPLTGTFTGRRVPMSGLPGVTVVISIGEWDSTMGIGDGMHPGTRTGTIHGMDPTGTHGIHRITGIHPTVGTVTRSMVGTVTTDSAPITSSPTITSM